MEKHNALGVSAAALVAHILPDLSGESVTSWLLVPKRIRVQSRLTGGLENWGWRKYQWILYPLIWRGQPSNWEIKRWVRIYAWNAWTHVKQYYRQPPALAARDLGDSSCLAAGAWSMSPEASVSDWWTQLLLSHLQVQPVLKLACVPETDMHTHTDRGHWHGWSQALPQMRQHPHTGLT